MPYKSDAQRRYFNANRDELEAQGVDVDEWNDSSRGKKLPERSKKKRKKKASISLGTSQVHGTGLFTTEDIKQGTKFARAMVRMRGKDAQSRYELTKAARYTNHSQDPSAQMVKVGNEIYLVALKDIPANAEVLVDYRKTASVLGPGSYITFRGEKRATWDALEKQAQEGVSFTEKQAFGYGDDYSSTGRYLDGGEIWGMSKKDALEFTRQLQEEAAKNELDLLFSGDRFDTSYGPAEALRRM